MLHVTRERGAGLNLLLSFFVLALVGAGVATMREPIWGFVRESLYLNMIIAAVFALGVAYSFFLLIRVHMETSILEGVREHFRLAGDKGRLGDDAIRNLPSSIIRERLMTYSELSRRSCGLDSSSHAEKVAMTMTLHTSVTRYIASLLVFLGLLGTFIGLLMTLTSVKDLITGQLIDQYDSNVEFMNAIKAGLGQPLSGMATAFSTSVFGMSTSLILGFLHLQVASAQTRYIARLESLDRTVFLPAFLYDSLATATLTAGPSGGRPVGGGMDETIARYIEGSQRQMKENLDGLVDILARTERMQSNYREVMQTIGDEIETTNNAIAALSANQELIREALGKLVDIGRSADESDKMVLAQLKSNGETLARLCAAQRAAQKSSEDFYKDVVRVFRQEAGAIQKSINK